MHGPEELRGRRAVLVVAHPGHELRVHGWLEGERPAVCVLTDGSGHGDAGRLPSTHAVLAATGAAAGPLLGCWSDREAYRILLERDVDAVRAVVTRLARWLVEQRAEVAAGDAFEGFNPVHDLCRLVLDVAILLAERDGGGRVLDLEFPLEAAPRSWAAAGAAIGWRLDGSQLARKLRRAHEYPELAAEVERALATHGEEAFADEWLYRVTPLATLARGRGAKLAYEAYGEARVAAGLYDRVLRHDEHFAPLAAALIAALQLETADVKMR